MQDKVSQRNEDYRTVVRKLQFHRQAAAPAAAPAASAALEPSPSPSPVGSTHVSSQHRLPSMDASSMSTSFSALPGDDASVGGGGAGVAGLDVPRYSVAYRAAHAVVWLGDFNYRLDIDRRAARAGLDSRFAPRSWRGCQGRPRAARDTTAAHVQPVAQCMQAASANVPQSCILSATPTQVLRGIVTPSHCDGQLRRQVAVEQATR